MKLLFILVLVVVAELALAGRRLRKGARCDDDPAWCRRGLTCVGDPGDMRCFRLRRLGQKCGRDPFWVCKEGLECEYNVCVKPKIGKRGSCNEADDVCENGLSCVGNEGNKKCFALRGPGMRCGKDPFWVCEDGLDCVNKICIKPKIGKRGSCNEPDDVCEDGLTCVGNKGNMKCFALRGPGMRCGKDPFWVCEDGLDCEYNICVKPKIGKRGSCNEPGDVCEDGLSCVGNDGNKKCFALRGPGMRCGKDPFWVCEDGLNCEYNICVKPKIGKRGSCNAPDDVCEDGLSCVGNDGNKKCFALRGPGMRCGKDPFWVCEDGLDCEYNICVKPKIGKRGSCNSADDVCEDGLSCLGNEGNKKCFALRGPGMRCGKDPFWVCAEGLACKRRRCAEH